MELLDRAAVMFQLWLTKADGVKPAALGRKIEEAQALARARPAAHPEVVVIRSESGRGCRIAGGNRGAGAMTHLAGTLELSYITSSSVGHNYHGRCHRHEEHADDDEAGPPDEEMAPADGPAAWNSWPAGSFCRLGWTAAIDASYCSLVPPGKK